MARNCKSRCVFKDPICKSYKPDMTSFGSITLNVDEFEAIRLIDLEKKTQAEASKLMGVARTTIQAIYESARFKIAFALVNVRELKIGGGEYYLREASCSNKKENKIMIIAVTVLSNNQVNQHFGRSESFKLYEVEDGAVKNVKLIPANVENHHALPSMLKEHNVSAIICGGLGGPMMAGFVQNGIQVFSGVEGDADSAVEALLRSEIAETIDANCNHHHDEGCGCHDGCCGEGHHHDGCHHDEKGEGCCHGEHEHHCCHHEK